MTRSCVIWKLASAICANSKTVVRRSSNPSLNKGKLTDALEKAINTTLSKTELEDLYLPYKPKRRTRGQIAIEAGLEPLADLLWNEPAHDPEAEAAKYIDADKGVADSKAAWTARAIF